MQPSPVIFDLDGTVWDSAPGIVSCMEATLAELGLPVPPRAVLGDHLGPPLMTMLGELGVPEERLDDARVVYRRHYSAHGEFECTVYPGIADLLDRLRDAGHPTATATSKGVESAVRMLEHFDLRRRFDVVAAASMTKTGHSKIDVVAEAMDGLAHLGAPAREAWMVGDRIFDIEAGAHFGLTTIGVAWGYAPERELHRSGCDHIASDVDHLGRIVAGREA